MKVHISRIIIIYRCPGTIKYLKRTMKFLKTMAFTLLLANYCNAQKLTDTIFYNYNWKICEKPIAEYYRMGTLSIDSFWFFTGIIKDYTTDSNTLIMQGRYSEDGYKNGPFEFYFPNGNTMLKGNYINDKMQGVWEFFYTNGNPKATIYLPADINQFTILNWYDETGKQLLKDGNGEFIWRQHEMEYGGEDDFYGYVLTGEFKDSLRSGTWKYYRGNDINTNTLRYKETYTKGVLKKAIFSGYYTQKVDAADIPFYFEPEKIKTTEKILYDEFLTKYDSLGKNEANFINYIIKEESPVISLKEKEFAIAFQQIILTLEKYRRRINYTGKEISGEIEFKIADKGYPEEVAVKGNITDKEKNFILYVMDKFRGIQMPVVDSSIAVEGYHKLYFYTFNPQPFTPAEIRAYVPDKDFIFSSIPKEKFLEFAKTIKKQFRRLLNRR